MSVVSNSVSIRASMGWRLTKTVTGFDSPVQAGGLAGSFSPATATFTNIYTLATATIAASGTQALDFYSFTEMLGDAVIATKICGILITAGGSVSGGVLKIEPHGTTPLTWPFAGTTPSISLTVGTTGAGFMIWQGTSQTMSTTVRQYLLTNTGTQSITVTVSAVVGA